MTCLECEREQLQYQHHYPGSKAVFVRIDKANVMVLGCQEHVSELLKKLSQAP